MASAQNTLAHYVLGAGRWGSWLARRLQGTVGLAGIVGFRESANALAAELNVASVSETIHGPAIVWLCTPDDAIAATVRRLDTTLPSSVALVHASGSIPLPQLSRPTGVVWPIQSITASIAPDWANLPLVVQASDKAYAKTLGHIARQISAMTLVEAHDDEHRQKLHLAACYTQNFTNLLWRLTADFLNDADLDYRQLLPLASNHLEKLAVQPPDQLQTGPASRSDNATIRKHLEGLTGHQAAQEVYVQLSALIERLAK